MDELVSVERKSSRNDDAVLRLNAERLGDLDRSEALYETENDASTRSRLGSGDRERWWLW